MVTIWRERREVWREKRKVRIFGKGKCKLVAICANFWQRKCKLIANFSATMVTSLPSVSVSLSLSLKVPHARYIPSEQTASSYFILLRQDPPPLEAILVIFGRRALIFFVWKLLEKNEKWRHFCAHVQWWSPWRRKNVLKGHLAPSSLTFLIIAIDTNGFRRMKEEGLIYKMLPQIFLIFA